MITLFFYLLIFIGIIFAGYRLTISAIRKWTGCSTEVAIRRVNRMANSLFERPLPDLIEDSSLENDIWNCVRMVIGEERFKQLQKLYFAGEKLYIPGNGRGVSVLNVSVFINDDNEKMRLSTLVKHTLQEHLVVRQLSELVDYEWTKRDDLAMDVLKLYFAQSDEELTRLQTRIRLKKKNIIKKNSDITDDNDEEDDDDVNRNV